MSQIIGTLDTAHYTRTKLFESGVTMNAEFNSVDTLLALYDTAKNDLVNLNSHTSNALRASAAILNCNDNQIDELVSRLLNQTAVNVKINEYNWKDVNKWHGDAVAAVKDAESQFWATQSPTSYVLGSEKRFATLHLSGPDGGMVWTTAQGTNARTNAQHKLSDDIDLDGTELNLLLSYEAAIQQLAPSENALFTQSKEPETLEDLSTSTHFVATGSQQDCLKILYDMKDKIQSWLDEFESEHGTVMLSKYSHNAHWTFVLADALGQKSPLFALPDDAMLYPFKKAFQLLLEYEQTILKNIHPAHLALLKSVDPHLLSSSDDVDEKLFTLMTMHLSLEKDASDSGDRSPELNALIPALSGLCNRNVGLLAFVTGRLVQFHSLLSSSLKTLVMLTTETLLSTHDEHLQTTTRPAAAPFYQKVSGKRAKERKQKGLKPRAIVTSPGVTLVDFHASGFEPRSKSGAGSGHEERASHTKGRHWVQPHMVYRQERVLVSGKIQPAKFIMRSGHYRGVGELSTKARRIK